MHEKVTDQTIVFKLYLPRDFRSLLPNEPMWDHAFMPMGLVSGEFIRFYTLILEKFSVNIITVK